MDTFCALFALALGALIVLMSLDVLMRYFGVGSLGWITELTEYVMYGGTFLSAAYVLRQGGHVRVDVLLANLPRRYAVRLEQIIDLCGLVVSLILLAYGILAVSDAFRLNMMQFKTWTTPEWLLLIPIPAGAALLAIEFLLRALRVEGVLSNEYRITDRPSL